jgi:hypothetical protein
MMELKPLARGQVDFGEPTVPDPRIKGLAGQL